MDLLNQIIVIAVIIASPIILIWLARRLSYNRARIAWLTARDNVLIRILVPKNNEKTPLAAEQMFAALHGIYEPGSRFQEHISFEIASRDKYIQFYFFVPSHLREFVEGQIYAQYPTAEITQVDDYTEEIALSTEPYFSAGAELTLNKNEVYPIKTFQSFEVDPLSGITSVVSQVGEGEQVWVQLLVRPEPDIWKTKGTAHISGQKSGMHGPFYQIVIGKLFHLIAELFGAVVRGPSITEVKKEENKKEEKDEGLKGVELKVAKLGFASKIRFVAIAKTPEAARAKLNAISGAYKQFNTLNLNGFVTSDIQEGPEVVATYRARTFEDQGMILNIEELASLYHLPSVSVATPSIVWAGSKTGEPPSNLPLVGSVSPQEITPFASTRFRAQQQKFGIKLRDRRYHMYAIGKTGTGKSTLLENMIIDDIKEGRGIAVVDPHGDLIQHVLQFVPPERADDVVLFAPGDSEYPIGFNVLENVNPELKNIVASGVVGIFKKIFGESWGPRLEYILRNTVIGLMDYPDATMLGIVRMLTNNAFRKKVIAAIKDPVIKAYFVDEFERYDPKFRTEAIAPIQNKVGQFLSSSLIRNIVGQPRSTINIGEIMDSGKILLLDLSIGKIGEDSAALLGAMMITKIQLASMQRAYIPEEDRRDFYLYVDEFQNFATDSFATILSEARKYHLNLVMTNQFISQMPETVASAVFGNIGTLISFRVGATDAGSLVKEYEPVFDANDMVNLDNYHIYVKMSVDGVTTPAFSAQTFPPRADREGDVADIVRRSQEKYGRPRNLVEAAIMQETQEAEAPPPPPPRDSYQPPQQGNPRSGSQSFSPPRPHTAPRSDQPHHPIKPVNHGTTPSRRFLPSAEQVRGTSTSKPSSASATGVLKEGQNIFFSR